MYHTVGAAGVLSHPVSRPVRHLHQFLVRCRVIVIEQIARALPTKDIVSGVSPWQALVILIACQEIQVEGAMVESPVPVFSKQEQVSK